MTDVYLGHKMKHNEIHFAFLNTKNILKKLLKLLLSYTDTAQTFVRTC